MKTTLTLLISLTCTAFSQTTWFYGASDNKATFGVTADNSQAITWMDSWAGGTNYNSNKFGTVSLQVNRPNVDGGGQSIIMFGFDGTGLTSSQVGSASLYLRQDFSFPTNVPNTWNIVGIAAGNNNWDTNTMSWNDINGASAGDWTGGTLGGSLSGSYGTFQDLGTSLDGNVAIDLTSAFKAYLDGSITGIAFVNATNGNTFTAANYAFVPFSNDNVTATNRPGLLVTAIPEPSSALFGLIGAVALFRRRRI
jgi:hypothetical protein